jgi:molybdenum cofactor synthesis domain-containing protein
MCKGEHMSRSEVKEGKIELSAECDGLLKVHQDGLKAVNGFGQMMIATRHGNFEVHKGDKLAGTRIIPLVIEEEKMEAARQKAMALTGNRPILTLLPFVHKKVGIVTTGNEVFYGRIEDTFTPVIEEKIGRYDTEVIAHETFEDNDTKVTASILRMIEQGADVVICTGGMSVDPDDKTPLAIKNTGARIVSYGAPVLPGAMFLIAYYEVQGENPRTVTIMGLPGCVMYSKKTIFDLILPRVMADDEVTAEDLAALGEGGLCLNCKICTFPNCGFGKGK